MLCEKAERATSAAMTGRGIVTADEWDAKRQLMTALVSEWTGEKGRK